MRYFISLFFVLFFNTNNCSAQNEKIKLSSIINSILSSESCSLKNDDDKLYFRVSVIKNDSFEKVVEFDSFNSTIFQLLYGSNKKQILRKLKKVEYGYVVSPNIVQREINELELHIDIPRMDYELYLKNGPKVSTIDTSWDMHYTLKEGKWVLTKMICNGF